MELRQLYLRPILIIIFFFLSLYLYSKFGPSLPINVLSQTRGEPLVVNAEGRAAVPNDTAKVTVGIEEVGASLSQTQASANTKAKMVTDELKRLGISDTDIKTVNYNIYPEQSFDTRPARITGYRVSASYEIKVKNLDQVNEVIAVATRSGANVVGNISFDVNDETRNEKLNEARAEAVKKAKEKASGLAQASGVTLGRIINISEFESGKDYYPMPLREVGTGTGDAASDLPQIQPGTNEVIVNVNVIFELR